MEKEYEMLSDEMKQLLTSWISEYIQPAKLFNHRFSSYRLKHLFERAAHKYVSNDQFKMAMLKAGYSPYDPAELNWHFKICKVDSRLRNVSFYDWCVTEYPSQDSVVSDLVRSMHDDKDFPKGIVGKRDILDYLRRQKSSEAVKFAFNVAWNRYQAEVSIR